MTQEHLSAYGQVMRLAYFTYSSAIWLKEGLASGLAQEKQGWLMPVEPSSLLPFVNGARETLKVSLESQLPRINSSFLRRRVLSTISQLEKGCPLDIWYQGIEELVRLGYFKSSGWLMPVAETFIGCQL